MIDNETKSDAAAFAKAAFYHPDGGVDGPQEGLTKREYFAVMAMQGLLANTTNENMAYDVAKEAVIMADELINRLNKTNSTT